MKKFSFPLCLVGLTLLSLSWAHAATYNVKSDGSGQFRTIQECANAAKAGDTCLVAVGEYPEHVATVSAGSGESGRISFKAQGAVSMRGFDIKHPYITIEGFTITGYGSAYRAHIWVERGAHYCQVLNNVIRDGAASVGGITFNSGLDAAASNCLVSGNTFSNLLYPFIALNGANHTLLNNLFEFQNSQDYLRLFGRNHIIRRNIFRKGIAKPGSGSHPDFVQMFGYPSSESVGHLIEENWIENLESQFSQMNSGDGSITIGRGSLYNNVRDITFRRNVIASISSNANVGVPGVRFENNTFYRLSYEISGIGFGGSLSRGDASNGAVYNNVFLEGGSRAATVGDSSGFYGVSGANLSREVIMIHVTLEPTDPEAGTYGATNEGIFADLKLGYLAQGGAVSYKFDALQNASQLILSSKFKPYQAEIYQALLTAKSNGAVVTTANFGFLPPQIGRSALLTELSKGYIDANGQMTVQTKALSNISEFQLSPQYQAHKSKLYDVLLRTLALDASIRSTFRADFNYVAGAQTSGFPAKSALACGTESESGFCEQNGINGGDPKLVNLLDPDGPDNVPFTLDDGLKPKADSPLCKKGQNGVDIGALSCDSGEIFAGGADEARPLAPSSLRLQ